MASFSPGDKVRTRVKINGGMFGTDVPADTDGVVLTTNWSGTRAKIHFTISGFFGDNDVDVDDVDVDYLEKRW
ncbi:hypothetical protein ACFOYW_18375 [Gryllotalpicola reticulitermitis]|uniref:Lipoprotein n=1 Tax=Gryllotalpicola reticulitermitis TaxID=1184153 RepID=A0ABV8QAK1_9MICO